MSTSARWFATNKITTPCDADWEGMIGNDQVRFCEHCQLHVNNLSAMTRSEAIKLVARSRGRICIRYVQTAAGEPLIGKMPEKLHHIGRRVSRIAAGAFSAAITVTAVAAQTSPATTDATSCATQQIPEADRAAVNDEFSAIVRGTIRDVHEVPIAGATVVLVDRESGEERYATSLTTGGYSFQGLPAGDYLIWSRKPRYDSVGDTAEVHASSRLVKDFKMSLTSERVSIMGGAMVRFAKDEDPLATAVTEDNLAAVRTLAFSTQNINSISTQAGTSLLAEAVDHGNREIVQLLLLAGADVNLRSRGGATPLMSLSEKTGVDIVRDLLDHGAHVNARDDYGDNAPIIAATASNVAVLKELISAGGSIDVTNSNGRSPLFGAVRNNVESVDLLLKSGADLNLQDDEGRTPLMAVASEGDFEMFQTLVDRGARTDLIDYEGNTILMAAASNKDQRIAEFLIQLGANLDAQSAKGTTALMVAAETNQSKTLALLMSAGAGINMTDTDGQTALARVVWFGSDKIIPTLLDAGADFTIKDNEGRTPLAIAVARENDDVVKLLKSRGARQ